VLAPPPPVNPIDLDAQLTAFREGLCCLSKTLHQAAIGQQLMILLESHDEIRLKLRRNFVSIFAMPGVLTELRGGDLLAALVKANGDEPKKMCNACGTPKPLSAFARCKQSEDGHWYYCLLCERQRVRKHRLKKNGVVPAAARA
jgi:hypothetical protein